MTDDVPAELSAEDRQLTYGLPELVDDLEVYIAANMKSATENLINNGRALIALKAMVPHGEFTARVEMKFGLDQRKSRRLMQVARAYGGERAGLPVLDGLSAQALFALSAPSTPNSVREELEARAEAGETITEREVRERVREADAEACKANAAASLAKTKKAEAYAETKRLGREIERRRSELDDLEKQKQEQHAYLNKGPDPHLHLEFQSSVRKTKREAEAMMDAALELTGEDHLDDASLSALDDMIQFTDALAKFLRKMRMDPKSGSGEVIDLKPS